MKLDQIIVTPAGPFQLVAGAPKLVDGKCVVEVHVRPLDEKTGD